MKKIVIAVIILSAHTVTALIASGKMDAAGIQMLQLIMLGMGTRLSLDDFKQALTKPKGILMGTAMGFGIMPNFGILFAKLLNFH